MSNAVLTLRELEVLSLAASGKSDREIGATLQLSIHTINTHFRNVFKKMGAANRVHAVSKALTAGLIRMDDNQTS